MLSINTEYLGWTNRSTWCAYGWLTSDEMTYSYAESFARREPWVLAHRLEGLARDTLSRLARDDIGDFGLVNWSEIAKAFSSEDDRFVWSSGDIEEIKGGEENGY